MPLSEFDPPFEVLSGGPQNWPVIFNSPHSGSIYPRPFLDSSRLDALTLRRSEDCYVDELFASAVALGCPLLKANFPRAYLDLNREPYELDPRMFQDTLPDYANAVSLRVAGGLGTIPRIVSENEEIYRWKLTWQEAEQRIGSLYHPYHRLLADLMGSTRARFGCAVLIDCHSMPSTAAMSAGLTGSRRPDVILGDRFGSACLPDLTQMLEELFTARGLKVTRNKPYAGGHITQTYGRPCTGAHALQIEVNRALYMNERTFAKTGGFHMLQRAISGVIRAFAPLVQEVLSPPAIAAE